VNLRGAAAARLLIPGAFVPKGVGAQPAPPPPAAPILTDRLEATAQVIDLPKSAIVSIYKTKRPWRALDVLVDLRSAAFSSPGSVLSVFVWAISAGQRSLVASGRCRQSNIAARPVRLATVRSVLAETFEVEVGYNVTEPQPQRITVTAVGSDDETPTEDTEGAITISTTNLMQSATSIVTAEAFPELVAINAVPIVAARFLHIHNQTTALPGRAPLFCFPLGPIASAGNPILPLHPILRNRLLYPAGFGLAISTTPLTTTLAAAGDVLYQAWFR
jgi:hypothetical protein